MELERLARMEEKLDGISQQLCFFIDKHDNLYGKHHDLNLKVQIMEAKAKGAWWVFLQMGGFVACVASVVAWVVSEFKR